MNIEQRVKNNKLIFDFLGPQYIDWTFENRTSWISARKNLKTRVYKAFDSLEDLKYHKSWDWLMSVVDKIESMGYNFCIASYGVEEKRYWCDINKSIDVKNSENVAVIDPIESNKKIKCVYLACLTFINYVNNSVIVEK